MVDTTVDTTGLHHHDRDAADPDLPAGTEIGEYVVEEAIGRGGMGVVYRATHPVIGGRVAIKVLAMDRVRDPQHVNRFIQEARTANEIRHRNIVDVFTIGRLETGQVYCVMEYLEGISLADHLRTNGALSVTDALVVLHAVARALDAAHAKGVVHRDIKPGNIFLLRDSETGTLTQAKLLDFGVAKLLATSVISAEHRTETGSWVGTPAYMPPEQWNAKDVDARADVYSFGVMAYQMLTGQLPYKADNFAELLVLQQTELPRPASQLAAHLPPAVDDVLVRAMHKDAARRFEKCSEVVTALADATRRALPSVPSERVTAASGRIAVPTARPRRTRWLVIAAGGIAFAIAAVTVAAWPSSKPTTAAAPTTAAETPTAPTTGSAPTTAAAPPTAAETPTATTTAAATPTATTTGAATTTVTTTAAPTPTGAATTTGSTTAPPTATTTGAAPTTAAGTTTASTTGAATPTTVSSAPIAAPPSTTPRIAAGSGAALTGTTSPHSSVTPSSPPTVKPVRAKPSRAKRAPASKSTGEVVDDMAVPL